MHMLKTFILVLLFCVSEIVYSNNIKLTHPYLSPLDSSKYDVKIIFNGQRPGKPPLRFNYVNLVMKNNYSSPKWFLFPYWGDDTLKTDGVFGNHGMPDFNNIEGKEYYDSLISYKFVEIRFVADYSGDCFIAFYLPGNMYLEIVNYIIESWKDIPDMEVWEVDSLLVNGETPLNEWLPYDVLSSSRGTVKELFNDTRDNEINLNWDYKNSCPRTDLPTEKIKYIQSKGVKKYRVKMERDSIHND